MQHLKVIKISKKNIKLPDIGVCELFVTDLQLSRINLYVMEYGKGKDIIYTIEKVTKNVVWE